MPASSDKQANAARLAGAVKSGEFPKSKAGDAVKSMARMPMDKLKHFMKKEVFGAMSEAQKRRLLVGLRKLKEGLHLKNGKIVGDSEVSNNYYLDSGGRPISVTAANYHTVPSQYKSKIKTFAKPKSKSNKKEGYAGGGNTDITNADNLVAEDSERTVVAKTFDTTAPFDSYVNQHRGIEMTPKEQQAILGYRDVKPTQQDRFSVKFEKTDDFGTNDTTVIKKLKDGQQFCWTAFTTHAKAEDIGKPEKPEPEPAPQPQVKDQPAKQPQQAPQQKQQTPQATTPSKKQSTIAEQDAVTDGDEIRIIKSTTFVQDTDGANVLGDFLRTLDL